MKQVIAAWGRHLRNYGKTLCLAGSGLFFLTSQALAAENGDADGVIPTDLSVWGMYQHADVVVKVVMIGLLLASVLTWAMLFSKGASLLRARKRLLSEIDALSEARTLAEAMQIAKSFPEYSISAQLLEEAHDEIASSRQAEDTAGIKERTQVRLERGLAAVGRYLGRGNGYLATVGAIAPFVGLFGTVWGIMNSFIGIAQTQTTNLAVVAPGIAEALLATAIGLVAAIPAVVIYNVFARMIGTHKALMRDLVALIMLLQGRDLDTDPARRQPKPAPSPKTPAAVSLQKPQKERK